MANSTYDYEHHRRLLAQHKRGGVKRRMRLPTLQELLRVRASLAATASNEYYRRRDLLIVDLQRVFLLRISEVLSLHVKAIDWERGTLTIYPYYEKNAREKVYRLDLAPPWLLKDLRYYNTHYRHHFQDGYYFCSTTTHSNGRPFLSSVHWIHDRWHRAVQHAGLGDLYQTGTDGRRYRWIRTHHWRALGITTLLNAGMTIKQVQALTQHSCPETILRYYWHLEEERAREQVMREHITTIPAATINA